MSNDASPSSNIFGNICSSSNISYIWEREKPFDILKDSQDMRDTVIRQLHLKMKWPKLVTFSSFLCMEMTKFTPWVSIALCLQENSCEDVLKSEFLLCTLPH